MIRKLLIATAIFPLLLSACSLPVKTSGRPLENDEKSETKKATKAQTMTQASRLRSGRLVIIQTATSSSETFINVMAPRLKNYTYTAVNSAGAEVPVKKYETIQYAPVFYKVDKLHIKDLKVGTTYKLRVTDVHKKYTTIIDERSFTSLDTTQGRANFALVSCMADDWRFDTVIDPIWERLREQNPDFVILNGDVVYVDSFDFVERKRATEQDIWQRYIDSFNRIPYFHDESLTPTLATWDDHDYGTNDGDRTFLTKDSARRVFRAFFGNPEIKGTYEVGPGGTYAAFKGYGQKFYLMDNRSSREPKEEGGKETFGHWGEIQHRWLTSSLMASDAVPSWIVNGNQFFSGKNLNFKESFEQNHPVHFRRFLEDLQKVKVPVGFLSGDIHFTEIMKIPAKRGLGYDTYEITSSAMHSYAGEGWDNPLRLPNSRVLEFNFVMIQSRVENGTIFTTARSLGLDPGDYFKMNFDIQKTAP